MTVLNCGALKSENLSADGYHGPLPHRPPPRAQNAHDNRPSGSAGIIPAIIGRKVTTVKLKNKGTTSATDMEVLKGGSNSLWAVYGGDLE